VIRANGARFIEALNEPAVYGAQPALRVFYSLRLRLAATSAAAFS